MNDDGIQEFLKGQNATLLEDLELSASIAAQAELITDRTAKLLSVSILCENRCIHSSKLTTGCRNTARS